MPPYTQTLREIELVINSHYRFYLSSNFWSAICRKKAPGFTLIIVSYLLNSTFYKDEIKKFKDDPEMHPYSVRMREYPERVYPGENRGQQKICE
jgi:hypothetical protein